jgi:hypothetical protein
MTAAESWNTRALPPRPPENLDAEQALLGALMINNKLFDQIAGICSAEHFVSAMHARLFTQLVVLISTGKTAGPVTLKSFAETDNALQASGGKTYLMQLLERGAVLDRAGGLHYAGIIANLAKRRALIGLLLSEIDQTSREDHNRSISDVLARVKGELDELARDAPDRLALFDPRDLTGQPTPQRADPAAGMDRAGLDPDAARYRTLCSSRYRQDAADADALHRRRDQTAVAGAASPAVRLTDPAARARPQLGSNPGSRLAARTDAGVWLAIPEGMTLDGARELMSYGIPLRTRLREQAARPSVC